MRSAASSLNPVKVWDASASRLDSPSRVGSSCPAGGCDACCRGRDDLFGPFIKMNRLNGTLHDGRTRLFSSLTASQWQCTQWEP